MHIEIRQHPVRYFEVHVVGAGQYTMKMYRAATIEDARMCAERQAAAQGNCQIIDRTGLR
jgi:hypothetical protein